ncbi:hypothetical protein AVEN_214490-1 [Araneus ventricosus]|uniref:Uncharacterized protein n=1 Tax=Araneus ventricosus TaxID=182803 RepID=A0A4Y2CXZ3_ARAVE|nr:hypothetical protein AVEN_214490-1 [Araneus ventricosus]
MKCREFSLKYGVVVVEFSRPLAIFASTSSKDIWFGLRYSEGRMDQPVAFISRSCDWISVMLEERDS